MSIQVTAIGPDGRPKAALPLRMDMFVGGVGQDYGTLSGRNIVTNSSGVASVVYTAPPSPTAGISGTCKGLPGNCVDIVATATGLGFETAAPGGCHHPARSTGRDSAASRGADRVIDDHPDTGAVERAFDV